MEIEIKKEALIDFPVGKDDSSLILIDDSQVGDLVDNIRYGPQSCYLVSGYRGAGKTSFINKVEHEIGKLNSNTPRQDIVFVNIGFAGFSNFDLLVKKLIRELYRSLDSQGHRVKSDNNRLFQRLRLLYERTFKEVSVATDKTSSIEKIFLFEIPTNELLSKIARDLFPMGLLLLSTFVPFSIFKNEAFAKGVAQAICAIWSIANLLGMRFELTKRSSESSRISTRTLYDDEIAGSLFQEALKDLKDAGVRIVFVLDELDKLPTRDVQRLIKDMKVYLLSGNAIFILIGGQNLYYRFRSHSTVDDSILSSLFAKIYHIPISTSVIFREYFREGILDKDILSRLSMSDRGRLNEVIDYLIFESRLVRRRLVLKIRQHVVWRNGKPFLSDNNVPRELRDYSMLIEAIDSLDDSRISGEQPGPIRDFIVMNLYKQVSKMLSLPVAARLKVSLNINEADE